MSESNPAARRRDDGNVVHRSSPRRVQRSASAGEQKSTPQRRRRPRPSTSERISTKRDEIGNQIEELMNASGMTNSSAIMNNSGMMNSSGIINSSGIMNNSYSFNNSGILGSSGRCSLDHSLSVASPLIGALQRTEFDVDYPRRRSKLRRDDASTVASVREYLSEEQRAWAGIESVLDDGESIATKEVLPAEIAEAMSASFSKLQSYRQTTKPNAPLSPRKEDENEGDEYVLKGHDLAMKQFCGIQSQDLNAEMPSLHDASFSSLRSEMSGVQSLFSYISTRNLIVQEEVTDEPLKEFLGAMTRTLERKKHSGPMPSFYDGSTKMHDLFSWSSRAGTVVDETQPTKQCSQMTQTSSMVAPSSPQHKYFPQSISSPERVEEELNSSMPSLDSVRDSEVSGSTHERPMWETFGDLKDIDELQEYESNGPCLFSSFNDEAQGDEVRCMEDSREFYAPPQPCKKKKMKKKIKKPMPKPPKSAKKLRPPPVPSNRVDTPEAFDDFFKGRDEEVISLENVTNQRSHSFSSLRATPTDTDRQALRQTQSFRNPDSNFISSILSPRGRSPTKNRYKDASPFKSLKSRVSMLPFFGKGRRGSPTSVIDTGRREAHFYPDADDQLEDDWGGLLSG